MTLDEVYRKIERVAEKLEFRKVDNFTTQNLPSAIVLEANQLTLVSRVYEFIMRAHENGDTLVRQKPEVNAERNDLLDLIYGDGRPMHYGSAVQGDIAQLVYEKSKAAKKGSIKPIKHTSTKETPKGHVTTDNTPDEANCPFLVYLVIPREETAPSERLVLKELRQKGVPYWMFSDRTY